MSNAITMGIFWHLIGAASAACFYAPFKKVKKWSWETMWSVGGIVSWIILPWAISALLLPNFWAYYSSFSLSTLLPVFLFGAMWGIGNINYGLTMRYLGMSMGIGIAIGITLIVGTLMTPIINGNFDVLISTEGGRMTLLGVLVALIGVGIVTRAGQLKERKMGIKAEEFNLKKGLVLAVMCGIFSAGMSFAMNAAKPMHEAAAALGVDPLYVALPSYVVIMGGGAIINLGFCFIRLAKVKDLSLKADFSLAKSLIIHNVLLSTLAGFVPNTNARQLKIQQSRSLVFVVKGTRNIFFSDFLVQLQRAATLYGYNGIVSYLDENANEIDAAEKILREIKPKGIIFLGGSVANFQRGFDRINVPSVLTTLVTDELDFPNLSMVGVDDRAAAYTAVDYLIRQGHRKIAVLGGPVTSYPSLMRRKGAQQAMEDAGILFNDKLYGLSNYDFESAYHAMNSLLARRAEFTALFAMSDVIAFGAIRALVSAGLRVPEDVSVIGFDGITMSRYCVPVMTTIVQPSEQIALQSIELLVRQIEHGSPAQTVTLQPELQQGESVRAI